MSTAPPPPACGGASQYASTSSQCASQRRTLPLSTGSLLRRRQALAMDHAHAARAARAGVEQEIGERVARFVAGHAVQVELALQRPVAAPQLRQDIGAEARAHERLPVLVLLADLPACAAQAPRRTSKRAARSARRRCAGAASVRAARARCVARLRGRQTLDVGERLREIDVAFGMLARGERAPGR